MFVYGTLGTVFQHDKYSGVTNPAFSTSIVQYRHF